MKHHATLQPFEDFSIAKSIGAGIAISIGCITNLYCENPIVGALLFSAGLFFVQRNQLQLFTGLCGKYRGFQLAWVLLFNLLGVVIPALSCTMSNNDLLLAKAASIINTLHGQPVPLVLLNAALCGALMNLACRNYPSTGISIVASTLAVACFVICGFWHSIATWGYYIVAWLAVPVVQELPLIPLVSVLYIALGNWFGARAINYCLHELPVGKDINVPSKT